MANDDIIPEAPTSVMGGHRKARAAAPPEAVETAAPARRSSRRHFGGKQPKMNAEPKPGWHRCYMNDENNNIAEALDCDYRFVAKDGQTNSDDPGNAIRVLAGTHENGEPMYAYLMEIPQEFWEEDQAVIAEHQRKVEAAIRGGNVGSVDRRYIPKNGISISRK